MGQFSHNRTGPQATDGTHRSYLSRLKQQNKGKLVINEEFLKSLAKIDPRELTK